jgi:hypothetical protein
MTREYTVNPHLLTREYNRQEMLKETKKGLPAPADGVDVHPFGWDENRRNLELIIQFAHEQQMLPRMMSVDELITDATRNLKP